MGAELAFDGEVLKGTIRARVTESRTVRAGAYAFEIDAVAVGELVVGTFVTRLEGNEVRRGKFAGSVGSAE